jgi:hypothetical protein
MHQTTLHQKPCAKRSKRILFFYASSFGCGPRECDLVEVSIHSTRSLARPISRVILKKMHRHPVQVIVG